MTSSAWSYRLYKGLWGGLDWLFPPTCGGCGKVGYRWCEECRHGSMPIAEPLCVVCGLPQPQSGICAECKRSRPSYAALRSWLAFEGPIRNALHRMKYRRDLGLGEALAIPISLFLSEYAWKVDLVVPIPLSRQRARERGYNQVGLVAFPLALSLRLKYGADALMRARHTRSQVGLTAGERRTNVRGAFRGQARQLAGKSILLMDDVATTGSTLASASDAALEAGAREVYCLTIARAFPRHGLQTV